jgi:hypothetical protein
MFDLIRRHRFMALAAFFALSLCFVGVGIYKFASSNDNRQISREYVPDVASLLGAARLAALPGNASSIKTAGWSGMFTGEECMTFVAPRDDIHEWLSRSTGIESESPKRFASDSLFSWADDNAPDWWSIPDDAVCRVFDIPPDSKGHNWGLILVDDKHNVVYIKIIWS